MNKITVTFDDANAVNLAKLSRLAKKAGKPLADFIADFLNTQVVNALSASEKGISYPKKRKAACR